MAALSGNSVLSVVVHSNISVSTMSAKIGEGEGTRTLMTVSATESPERVFDPKYWKQDRRGVVTLGMTSSSVSPKAPFSDCPFLLIGGNSNQQHFFWYASVVTVSIPHKPNNQYHRQNQRLLRLLFG